MRVTQNLATVGFLVWAVGSMTAQSRPGGPPQAAQAPPATPPPVAKPAAPPSTSPQASIAPRRAAPVPAPSSMVIVRDFSGRSLSNVAVTVSGPERLDARTDANGNTTFQLRAGSYRLRFAHDEFVTLERDVVVRPGRAEKIEVALSRAFAVAPAPEPPAPAPAPPPPAPVEAPPVPAGPPANVSIPDFLDKNFIGREPLKESVLACTPDAMTRVLQLRDPLAPHAHADLDEILYVVAGSGAVRIGEQVTVVSPGSLSVIPRGLRHAIERNGRNPLIVLSTLAGAPCKAAAITQP